MPRRICFALDVLIPTAFAVVFAAVWIAATGTFRPPLWVLVTASVGLGIVSATISMAYETRRWHPRGLRRRAHARTDPTTRKDTTSV